MKKIFLVLCTVFFVECHHFCIYCSKTFDNSRTYTSHKSTLEHQKAYEEHIQKLSVKKCKNKKRKRKRKEKVSPEKKAKIDKIFYTAMQYLEEQNKAKQASDLLRKKTQQAEKQKLPPAKKKPENKTCTICHQRINRKVLTEHMLIHLKTPHPSPNKCYKCKQSSFEPNWLQTHQCQPH